MMNRNNGSPNKPKIGAYSRHFQSTSGEDYGENVDTDDNENTNRAWDYVPQQSARVGIRHENQRISGGDHIIEIENSDGGRNDMVLDYFPENQEARNRNNEAYDEQYDANDSDSPAISPRDEFGAGDHDGDDLQEIEVHQPIEMTTFRMYNQETRSNNEKLFDEVVPVEDDDDGSDHDGYDQGHRQLYSRRNIGPYTPMRQEEQEEYEPDTYPHTRQPYKQVPVDARVPLFPSSQRSYGATSRNVKIEKTIKPRDGPPFGFPPDQRKITERTNALLENKKSSLEEGGGCSQNNDDSDSCSALLNDVTMKKKRKKKVRGNDDGSDSDLNSDINGNPTVSTGTRTNFPRTTADFGKYPFNGQRIGSLEPESSHESTAKDKRRARKKKGDGFVKACELPGHKAVDQDNVDKLLSFIEGQDSDKNKKVPGISNGPQNGPDKSAVRKNKKNKLVATNEKDDVVGGEGLDELSGGSMGNYPSETTKGEDSGSPAVIVMKQGTVVDSSRLLDNKTTPSKDTRINTDNPSMKKLHSDKPVKDKGTVKGSDDKITRDCKEALDEKDIPNKNNIKSKSRLRKDSVEKDSVKSARTEKNSLKESLNITKTRNEKIAKDSGGREYIRNDSVEKDRMDLEKQDAIKKLEIDELTESVDNHMVVVNNSLLNVPVGALTLSDNYRFTDLPVPKVEEEFTEVRKKKKVPTATLR